MRRTRATPVCVDFDYCSKCGGVGQDYNIDFWCSTCEGEGTIPARLCHYEVWTPEMVQYGQYQPEEPFICCGYYLAPSARAARLLAIKDPEFKEWVRDAAGFSPPQKGLKVRLFRCEHGVCIDCGGDPEEHPCGWACSECDKQAQEWDREAEATGLGA